MFQNTKFKEAEYRENQIGSDFLSCPVDDGTFPLNKPLEFLLMGRSYQLRISHSQSCIYVCMKIYFLSNYVAFGVEV